MTTDGRTIGRLARECGFDLCGVAAARSGEEDRHLADWLARGFHGDMGYMERRRDVRELLPGCRSVIALGVNYYVPESHGPGPRVSRYAWGRDYHLTVGGMLEGLVPELERTIPNEEFRAYCDTGPLLEKPWGQRAGLGWIGKNTQMLNRQLGSELFLGLLLTDVELDSDSPTGTDHCGRCTACLDACPTRAFPAPRILDARRCVGYLTVEHRADVPTALCRGIGTMVAGCDICQEVCPWTIRAPADLHPEFAPDPRR